MPPSRGNETGRSSRATTIACATPRTSTRSSTGYAAASSVDDTVPPPKREKTVAQRTNPAATESVTEKRIAADAFRRSRAYRRVIAAMKNG